jgi:hypothetical protein
MGSISCEWFIDHIPYVHSFEMRHHMRDVILQYIRKDAFVCNGIDPIRQPKSIGILTKSVLRIGKLDQTVSHNSLFIQGRKLDKVVAFRKVE